METIYWHARKVRCSWFKNSHLLYLYRKTVSQPSRRTSPTCSRSLLTSSQRQPGSTSSTNSSSSTFTSIWKRRTREAKASFTLFLACASCTKLSTRTHSLPGLWVRVELIMVKMVVVLVVMLEILAVLTVVFQLEKMSNKVRD